MKSSLRRKNEEESKKTWGRVEEDLRNHLGPHLVDADALRAPGIVLHPTTKTTQPVFSILYWIICTICFLNQNPFIANAKNAVLTSTCAPEAGEGLCCLWTFGTVCYCRSCTRASGCQRSPKDPSSTCSHRTSPDLHLRQKFRIFLGRLGGDYPIYRFARGRCLSWEHRDNHPPDRTGPPPHFGPLQTELNHL